MVIGFKNNWLEAVEQVKGCRWIFLCKCGVRKELEAGAVSSGKTHSCGCKHIANVYKHGLSRTAEQYIWSCMRQRCKNPKNPVYKHYGGRGIAVCERWNSFQNFYSDMGPRPTSKHSIERVDNDKGYDPTNCIWATRYVQAKNQRLREGRSIHSCPHGHLRDTYGSMDSRGRPWCRECCRIRYAMKTERKNHGKSP